MAGKLAYGYQNCAVLTLAMYLVRATVFMLSNAFLHVILLRQCLSTQVWDTSETDILRTSSLESFSIPMCSQSAVQKLHIPPLQWVRMMMDGLKILYDACKLAEDNASLSI